MINKLIPGTIIAITVVLVGFSGLQQNQAYALSGAISDEISCVASSGAWSLPHKCTVTDLEIGVGETLVLESSVSSPVTLENRGTMINAGTFQNNFSAFNNFGTIISSGTFNNDNFGSISNIGTFTNSGTFNNISAVAINFGTFTNTCDGILNLTNLIFGNPIIQESPCDTTPPLITAALEPIDVDHDDKGLFKVVFSASDDFDSNPAVTADINGIAVENGQIVELELDEDKTESEFDSHGVLEMEAPFFELTVTATDSAGNKSAIIISPVFELEDCDDEEEED